MTYDQAKPHFYRFESRFNSAQSVNGWPFKSRWRKEDFQALKWYMAQLGCLSNHGTYEQWWEFDQKTNALRKAQIDLSQYPTEKSIIRRPDCLYVAAYNEHWALQEIKSMQQQVHTFTGRVAQVFPIISGPKSGGGTWKRLEFLVEEDAKYPNTILFSIHGEKAETTQLTVGEDVTVDFQVSSSKRGERYYTDAKVISVKGR